MGRACYLCRNKPDHKNEWCNHSCLIQSKDHKRISLNLERHELKKKNQYDDIHSWALPFITFNIPESNVKESNNNKEKIEIKKSKQYDPIHNWAVPIIQFAPQNEEKKKRSKPKINHIIQRKVIIKDNISIKDYMTIKDNIFISIIRFPIKTRMQNVMTLIQYSFPVKDDKVELFLLLVKKLRLLISSGRKINFDSKLTEGFYKQEFINLGLESFLSQCSLSINLFSKMDFDYEKLSTPLKWTIVACGLSWVEQTEQVKLQLKYLEQVIWNHFSHLTSIRPTLQNLQAMLLIAIHLPNFLSTNSVRASLILQCLTISSAIGLHLFANRLNSKTRFERQLAYAALIFTSTLMDLSSGAYMATPFKPKNIDSANLSKPIYTCPFKEYVTKNEESLVDLILADYFCEIAGIVSMINFIKERFKISQDNKLVSSLTKILSQVKTTTLNYLFKLSSINNSTSNDYLIARIRSLDHMIRLLNHYIQFFILSLNFYHPSKDNKLKKGDSNIKGVLKLALLQCHLFIEHVIKLPPQFMVGFPIPMLSQCLAFLAQNQYYDNIETNRLAILNGLKLMESLNQYLVHYWPCKLNVDLIHMIIKSKNV
ncbi:hypothetical protein K502DRAFT_51046 [Neoconidiobolus thromboides FSU 785]|nr:hypothetical protein K502DRAFT_51046 [Neoconidiobolus thromboides FSU 785]